MLLIKWALTALTSVAIHAHAATPVAIPIDDSAAAVIVRENIETGVIEYQQGGEWAVAQEFQAESAGSDGLIHQAFWDPGYPQHGVVPRPSPYPCYDRCYQPPQGCYDRCGQYRPGGDLYYEDRHYAPTYQYKRRTYRYYEYERIERRRF